MVFKKLKKVFSGGRRESNAEDYLEIDLGQEKKDTKIVVKLFNLKDYEDANLVLNALREGFTIGIVDIRILKKKDPIELKRAVSKIKKTVDALEGTIAGFGENTLIITPSFARIEKEPERIKEEKKPTDEY